MVRTQVYLTKKEREGLAALARATGRKQSELIREAVDRLVEQSGRKRRDLVLTRAAGMWKDRKDLPRLGALRKQWDRGFTPFDVPGTGTKARTSDILAAIRDVRRRKR